MSTGSVVPFTPNAKTQVIAVSATSQKISFGDCDVLLLYNDNSAPVFVELGIEGAAVTATVPGAGTPGSMPIPPGISMLVGIPTAIGEEGSPITQIAAIAASGTADLYVTPGTGTQK